MKVTNYNKLKATRFIIPGYLEAKDEDWAQAMCKVCRTSAGRNIYYNTFLHSTGAGLTVVQEAVLIYDVTTRTCSSGTV